MKGVGRLAEFDVLKMLIIYMLINKRYTARKIGEAYGCIKLSASELKTLSLVADLGKASATEIARELNALPPQVSRVLATLKEKELIKTEKTGLSKTVSLSDAKHAELFRRILTEFSHIRFDDLLAGVSLEVLSALSYLRLKSRKEIQENSLVSEASVAKILEKLRSRGIVHKPDSAYEVNPRFQALKDFVKEFRHHRNQNIAKRFADDAVILWECNSEFIIESEHSKQDRRFLLTGPSAFGEFGITLIVIKSYYFHSPFARRLRLEDVILHSLLVPLSYRNIVATLLVWTKNQRKIDRSYFGTRCEKYGVKNYAKEIAEYFRSEGARRPESFPPLGRVCC